MKTVLGKENKNRSCGRNFMIPSNIHERRIFGEQLAMLRAGRDPKTEPKEQTKKPMINLNEIKITPRDQQVLRLLVQGCSNKEIASHLSISPRTVKQHLRTLFLRAGIKEGRKRVKLATAMFIKEQVQPCNPVIG
jgi:DNA-binding NarL/FixJ family response regulator